MRPLVFVLPYALVFWAAYVWSFLPEWGIIQRARSEARKEGSRDAGSIRVIFMSNAVAFPLSIALAYVRATEFSSISRVWWFYVGVGLLVLGSVLRRACWRALGEHFTGDVKASANQPVIQRGPYKWVRHPSYSGAMLMWMGVGLAMTNWLSISVMMMIVMFAYGYRVRVEEHALLGEIGEPYAEYMRTHKRFVPFIV